MPSNAVSLWHDTKFKTKKMQPKNWFLEVTKLKKLFFFAVLLSSVWGCITISPAPPARTGTAVGKILSNFPEGFEEASKSRYEAATIGLASGPWLLTDGLLGGSENDSRSGSKAIRLREQGSLRMGFDVLTGIKQVRIKYASYQTDGPSAFECWVSTNSGATWNKVGNTVQVSEKVLREAIFEVNTPSAARIEFRKVAGAANRLNLDELLIYTYETSSAQPAPALPTRDASLTLGNPSNASQSNPNDYLIEHTTYTLSYNRSRGIANWVSWHLSSAWKGPVSRQNDFRPDTALPSGWFAATPRDYTDTGFDRGHLCPSDDRDGELSDNQETFLMTNIVPQAPDHNRGIWKELEEYCRKLSGQGNELYIVAGTAGSGGTGSNGSAKSLANGKLSVPASLWKVIVVLPNGPNDAARVSATTRVIAVNIPNKQNLGSDSWGRYRLSVDELEALLGYDFLRNVPVDIQRIIESKTDDGSTF